MRNASKDDLDAIRDLSYIRWSKDTACPFCLSRDVSGLIETRGIYQCRSHKCRKQFGVFHGTKWQGKKIGPSQFKKQVRAIFEMMKVVILEDHVFRVSQYGGSHPILIIDISSRSFMNILGITSYSTAHKFLHNVKDHVNAIISLRDTDEVKDWLKEPGSLEDFTKHTLS